MWSALPIWIVSIAKLCVNWFAGRVEKLGDRIYRVVFAMLLKAMQMKDIDVLIVVDSI